MRIEEKHYWEKLEHNLLSPIRHFGAETKINEITVCEQKLFQKMTVYVHCINVVAVCFKQVYLSSLYVHVGSW